MATRATVRFVTTDADQAVLETLERRADIDVIVSLPDGARADGGTSAVDCVVVDTDTVSPDTPQVTAADGTPVIRCAHDPPEGADDGWVEVGTVAGRRTLVDRIRRAASPADPALAATDDELVDGVPAAAYVLDVRGRFVAVNDAFLDLTGYERQALLGSHASLTVTETTEAAFGDHERTPVRVNAAAGGAIDCRRDAGVATVATPDGPVTRTAGYLEPRTAQPHIERNPAVLKRAIDAAHTPLSLSDPTREDNPLVYVNDAFERVTGYEREAVIGRNCRFLQTEDTDQETVAELRRAIDNEDPVTVEFENERADGSTFWNRLTVTPIYDETGELVHYLGSQEDITDRLDTEETLRDQRDALDLLNEMVRHDIRNDLQMVLSYNGAIADEADGEVAEFADRARQTARNATELTETARDLAGTMLRTDRDVHPVSLAEVVETEAEKARAAATDARITVGPLPDRDVLANEMLGSVLRNLLKNAVVHSTHDDTEIQVSAVADDDWVTVAIADDGPGVPDDQKAEIFERAKTGNGGNSGIGLYLVATLVGQYGGEVWVEDRQGAVEGSVFKFTLRLA
ncbi:PAS domain-containing sensor histidine kinase [Haloarcula marina]|uniref:PAS domain-containing sensor histidine kinase n=1 Tax=Haloarcula marina TaxID=2961574 RepID=UPI0020B7430D|nr:PAS domain S-box protein [Halomicroarcula marina]